MLDIEQIKQVIPHRYPFLLVDQIESVEEGKVQSDTKTLRQTNHFSKDISRTTW